jgi:hypothetical protein
MRDVRLLASTLATDKTGILYLWSPVTSWRLKSDTVLTLEYTGNKPNLNVGH